jgi:hypothetical protein
MVEGGSHVDEFLRARLVESCRNVLRGDHHNRTSRVMDDLIADRPEQETEKPSPSAGSDDKEICVFGLAEQRMCR